MSKKNALYKLPEKLIKKIKLEAIKQNKSYSEFVAEALRTYMNANKTDNIKANTNPKSENE